MIEFLIGLGIGLIVGWNFLPQPNVCKKLVDFVVTYVKSKLNGS